MLIASLAAVVLLAGQPTAARVCSPLEFSTIPTFDGFSLSKSTLDELADIAKIAERRGAPVEIRARGSNGATNVRAIINALVAGGVVRTKISDSVEQGSEGMSGDGVSEPRDRLVKITVLCAS